MGWIVEGMKHGQGSVLFFGFICGFLGVSESDRAASYTARLRSGQEAGIGAGP
jgi:hypothetical protein